MGGGAVQGTQLIFTYTGWGNLDPSGKQH